MTVQCLTIEDKEQYNICQGLASFIEHLAGKAQQWGDTFATAIRKTEVAREVGKDTRTVTRYLNQLNSLGLVETDAKRGRNGGTVVVFNTDILNFEPTDNPITSDSKEAREIRENVFPKAVKKEPKRRYRTKMQIAEERALLATKKSREEELNDLAESMPHITRDFFENFDNPRVHFQGYLVAQMFNAYVTIFPRNMYETFKESDPKKSARGLKYMRKAQGYYVMEDRFVGTPVYNKFVELAEYCNEHEINPLSYLTVQFQHAEWLADNNMARRSGVPFVNTLLSEDAKNRYKQNELHVRKMRNSYGYFGLTNQKVPYIGAKFPIVSSLLYAYTEDRTGQESLDFLLDELEENAHNSVKQTALVTYYETTKSALAESDLEPKDTETILQFLKEQIALYSRKNTLNISQYALAFPLQIFAVRCGVSLGQYTAEEYHTYIGNMYKAPLPTNDEFESFEGIGERIDFSYYGNTTFYKNMFMLADCRGLGVAINEVSYAINKFGIEKVPLDKFGMLDIKKIYATFGSMKEIEAENVKEFKQAQMMSSVMTKEA